MKVDGLKKKVFLLVLHLVHMALTKGLGDWKSNRIVIIVIMNKVLKPIDGGLCENVISIFWSIDPSTFFPFNWFSSFIVTLHSTTILTTPLTTCRSSYLWTHSYFHSNLQVLSYMCSHLQMHSYLHFYLQMCSYLWNSYIPTYLIVNFLLIWACP